MQSPLSFHAIQFLPLAIPLLAYGTYYWCAGDIVGCALTALAAVITFILGSALISRNDGLFGTTLIENRVFYGLALLFFSVFVLELAYFGFPLPQEIDHQDYGLPVVHHLPAAAWLMYLFAPATAPTSKRGRAALLLALLYPVLSGLYLGNRGMMLISALLIFLRASKVKKAAVVFVVLAICLFEVLGELRFPMELVRIDPPLSELPGVMKSWFSLYLFGSIWSSLQASIWPESYITNFTNTYWEFGYFLRYSWFALVAFILVWLVFVRLELPQWVRKITFIKIILSTFAVSFVSTTTISVFIIAGMIVHLGVNSRRGGN